MDLIKKHSILLGILLAVTLLLIATLYYPGGSQLDQNSVGFNWRHNYFSNLFGEKAVNGAPNTSRFWGVAGMLMLSVSFSLFFMNFSKKIPDKGAANMIKYFGLFGMLLTFLIATPLHDLMVTFSATIFLVSIFYIIYFVYKSKLYWFKLLCTVFMVLFYSTMIMYGFHYLDYLPIMQKVLFVSAILLVLGLEYFTMKEDFQIT